jgi:Domain of unknown function DUF222.
VFSAHARADGSAPVEPDGLRLSKVLDGRVNLSGELSSDAAETVTTALHAFMDRPTELDGRTEAQRRADALVRICEIALKHGAAGVRAAANVTIVAGRRARRPRRDVHRPPRPARHRTAPL